MTQNNRSTIPRQRAISVRCDSQIRAHKNDKFDFPQFKCDAFEGGNDGDLLTLGQCEG